MQSAIVAATSTFAYDLQFACWFPKHEGLTGLSQQYIHGTGIVMTRFIDDANQIVPDAIDGIRERDETLGEAGIRIAAHGAAAVGQVSWSVQRLARLAGLTRALAGGVT